MKTIRAAIFFVTIMLAAGAFAAQYPSGSSGMPQSQPQGGMQPGQATPSQTLPQQNQGTIQPGQSGQQAGQPAQTSPQPSGAPSIDDQVRVLSEQLSLSSDQQAKLRSALEDQHAQAIEIIQDNSMPRENKVMKIRAVRETTINRVRTSLNDDQKKKFDQMIQQQDQRTEQMHQQPGQQPPPKQ